MEVYGLIGHPVGHSLSPVMHNAGFAAIGRDASYVTFEPPRDGAVRAIRAADTLGIRGLNVTIPFKEGVMEAVRPDPIAARVGAVNTVVFGEQEPSGHNTDIEGALAALERHNVEVRGADAVLVGAGGAGRAIAYGLVEGGATVSIVNRTESRADALAAELDVAGYGLDALERLLPAADLLINATSVGMERDRSPVPRDVLHSELTVMDAVYRPLETRLLQDAAAVGAKPIDGAWMLLFQGTAAFERWTGVDAPVDAMNEALREAL